MPRVHSRGPVPLRRRLRSWQIFFIGIGGIIGIGFFRGSSTTLGIAGPCGALIAVLVVGIVAIAVMEGICELINLWPIPNAMVEYVRAFVDEDLGVAIGILYWYTYTVSFSALIIVAGDLTDYWAGAGEETLPYVWKGLIYAVVPWLILCLNAAPVDVFGWIEYIGGIVKLALVVGVIILMAMINAGADGKESIGPKYFEAAVQNNENVASSHFASVSMCIPLVTFSYIGIELLTVAAFEARDPHELKQPARNIAWFTALLYCISTGLIIANVSWQDQNLPGLFQQALTTISTGNKDLMAFGDDEPNTNAAPLIALHRLGFRFLPSFLNGCFIYSALSCANTALYVASRQLYGLTRSITVTSESNTLRRLLAWMSGVEYRTRSPWPALIVSVVTLYWLPFIRLHHDSTFLEKVQGVLIDIGSVSAVLVWCSQCVAYAMFFHWRRLHAGEIMSRGRYSKLFDPDKTGWFRILQPGLAYVGAITTFLIAFFFNTVSMWNGQELAIKAASAFVSPGVLLLIWLLKKFTRPRTQWKLFVNLRELAELERRLQHLDDLIYPVEEFGRQEMEEVILRDPGRIQTASRPPSQDSQPAEYTRSDLGLLTNADSNGRVNLVSPVSTGSLNGAQAATSALAPSNLGLSRTQSANAYEADSAAASPLPSTTRQWEKRQTLEGRPYYVDHLTRATTWTTPEDFAEERSDLHLTPHAY